MKNNHQEEVIEIAYPIYWNNLTPGEQHTMWSALILSNQFEALTGKNQSGIITPLAALSWKISDDYKVFTFKIDTNRKFSDGTNLSASDFKSSWENSLKLAPHAHNSNVLDLLYNIEGFENFNSTHEISGVKTIDNETLEIKFKTPFRAALHYLSAARYGVYKIKDNKPIGTGKYTIHENTDKTLSLEPNPFSQDFHNLSKIHISHIPVKTGEILMTEGKLDAYPYAFGLQFSKEFLENKNIDTTVGQESMHLVALVNDASSNILSNQKIRHALQWLIYDMTINHKVLNDPPFLIADPQVFMPYQQGRLEDSVVYDYIIQGKKYLNLLIEKTKEKPLKILSASDRSNVIEFLIKNGVTVSKDSKSVPPEIQNDYFYKRNDFDLYIGSFSISSGDPDRIYHALGKNGAIRSVVSFRKNTAQLLEDGRNLVDTEKVDAHYKKVSMEILKETPFIHLGFARAVSVVNNKKLTSPNLSIQRNTGHLDIFKLK